MLKGTVIDQRRQIMEQIAIGVSVVAKCQPCLQYHLKEARKLGISDTEIEATVKLARQIRSIADQKMDEFVGNALNNEGEETSVAAVEAQGCCPPAGEPENEKKDSACC